ncbi:MAG: hypothetical protein DMF04_10460, partial [Verrucomicrobia bacterium]
LLVVNAAKIDEDFEWLKKHLEQGRSSDQPGGLENPAACSLHNRSANFGGVAIQGPRTIDLFRSLLGPDVELPQRNHIRDFTIASMPLSIARTGYTGEDGVEVFFRAPDAAKLWNLVLERGAKLGLK